MIDRAFVPSERKGCVSRDGLCEAAVGMHTFSTPLGAPASFKTVQLSATAAQADNLHRFLHHRSRKYFVIVSDRLDFISDIDTFVLVVV